jgi:hypothetical protein
LSLLLFTLYRDCRALVPIQFSLPNRNLLTLHRCSLAQCRAHLHKVSSQSIFSEWCTVNKTPDLSFQ